MTDSENNSHTLSLEDSECDLGILFKNNLKFAEHIDKVVNKVNTISCLIKRKFTHIDKSTFLTLYKSLVRSPLDYGNLIFYPTTMKCKQILENAQRRATRLVPECPEEGYPSGTLVTWNVLQRASNGIKFINFGL